jgi:hypothetical protein
MIDLTEAGRRLADTRVGPTPSLDTLRAALRRRRQRRRAIAAGSVMSAAAVVAAITVAVVSTGTRSQKVTTGSSSSQPSSGVTLPEGPGVTGATPYDYQRLRLWLPAGWTTSTSHCPSATQVVYFPANYSGGGATSCTHDGAEIVVVEPYSATRPGPSSTTTVNRITVEVVRGQDGSTTWYVPSLQVKLVVSSNAAQKVADTLGPSPLQDLLTSTFPTPVPTAWRIVTFDGFQAKVPAAWPTHHIVMKRSGNTTEISDLPGVCAPPVFRSPSVYLGANPGISCPFIPQTKEPATEDGLWLQPSTNTAPLASQLSLGNLTQPPPIQRLFNLGSAQVLINAGNGDSVQAEIDSSGHRITAVIGLGANPAVAEAILSSIRPASQ